REPLSDAHEADYAAEVALRARRLGVPRLLFAPFSVLEAAFAVISAAHGKFALGAVCGGLALLALCALLIGRNYGRRVAETELAALHVVDRVMREGNVRAALRVRPETEALPSSDTRLCFELAPANRDACAVTLAADRKAISVWANGKRHRFREPNRLRELQLCLAALVAGRYWERWSEVSVRRPIALRPRRYLEITSVFETEDGRRRFTDRYGCGRALEHLRQAREQRGLSDASGATLERGFAPYERAV
ncbi:MAG: hypothetical protein M3295_07900, partial [Chloroflexota bacterium]|nr:hypothetical protein [Chloroflexota bacterium]